MLDCNIFSPQIIMIKRILTPNTLSIKERGLNGFAKAKTRSRSVGTDFLFIVLKSVFIRVFTFVNQFNPRPFFATG
ncbi:hypothetical protein OA93_07905 [Flavobacterium sp. KMS]|nr:hypothetical protein OA93_07905 [Flavobacterium sp. KMS]